ncbi:MAG: aldo/keto reductase [Nitrosopumilaceae archaeon]|nr:aldo/keto reductase [Nitrosopumilaceae archaeon]
MLQGHATPEGTKKFAASSPAGISNYRTFGSLTLSSVGMGTYLGDSDDATDATVESAVAESVRRGVNVLDTAINYRSQKAERALGRAVSKMVQEGAAAREGLFVSTKGGYVTDDGDAPSDFWGYVREQYVQRGVIGPGDISAGYHCMSISFLEDQLRRSLDNLDMECVDLLYLHNAVEGQKGMPREDLHRRLYEIMEWYESQRREGRIRYYGMATWDCFRVPPGDSQHLSLEEVVGMAERAGGPDHGMRFVQLPFNMYLDQALRQPTQSLRGGAVPFLEAARALGIGVFTSVPFMQGRLLEPGVLPEFGEGPPSVRSLQFLRSAPGVLAPLVGHKAPAHVAENMAVMGMPPLTPDQFDLLLNRLLS